MVDSKIKKSNVVHNWSSISLNASTHTKLIKHQPNSEIELQQELQATVLQQDSSYKINPMFVTDASEEIQDPACALSFLRQVQADQRITNQVMTPFNLCSLTQTMHNPLYPGEVITVKMITENVKQKLSNDPVKSKFKNMRCPDCPETSLVPFEFAHKGQSKNTLNCDQCGIKVDEKFDASFFHCPKCNAKDFCAYCVTNEFVKMALSEKSSQHKTFEEYKLESDQVEMESGRINQCGSFKKCQPPEIQKPKSGKYALVQLWKDSKESKSCYREYLIADPFSFRKKIYKPKQASHEDNKDVQTQLLALDCIIFVSEDKKSMFYFNQKAKGSGDEMVPYLNVVALDTACEEQICLPDEYEAMPCSQSVELMGVTLKAFLRFLKQSEMTPFFEPRLWKTQKPSQIVGVKSEVKTLLIFELKNDIVTREAQCDENAKLYTAKGRLKTPNIYFFDYKNHNVDFVIYQANCVIKFDQVTPVQREKLKPSELPPNTSVWVLASEDDQACYIKQVEYQSSQVTLPTYKEVDEKIRSKKFASLKTQDFKKFQLKDEPNSEDKQLFNFSKRQMQAFLHQNDCYCTIIVANEDWYTFKLDERSKQGDRIFNHPPMKDATFVSDPQSFYVVGNLQSIQKQDAMQNHQVSECNFVLELYNLDQQIVQDYSTAVKKQYLFAKLTSQFNQANVEIQHKIMPFLFSLNKEKFESQLYFSHPLTNQPQVMFFQAELQTKSRSSKDRNLFLSELKQPQVITQKQQQKVQYPFLMYTSVESDNTKLSLCHVATNHPQALINLGSEINFVCFVDTGSEIEKLTKSKNETCLFFLATKLKEMTVQLRLMYLQLDPWVLENPYNNVKLHEIDQEIHLTRAQILSIKSVVCLNFKTSIDFGFFLVIQLQTEIVSINLQKNQKALEFQRRENVKDSFMAPLKILCGPINTCYYVQRQVKHGDEIVSLGFQTSSSEFIESFVFKHQSAILQMQIQNDQLPTKNKGPPKIYILDSDMQFLVLSCPQTFLKSVEDSDQQFVVESRVSMKELHVNSVLRALLSYSWQSCVLSQSAITCSRYMERENYSSESNRYLTNVSTTYNLTSGNYYPFEFFKQEKKGDTQNRQSTLVWDVLSVQDIGKQLSIVQEESYSYFLLDQIPNMNRIDLMCFSQLAKDCKIFALNKVILVHYAGRILIFSTRSQLLIGVKFGIADVKVHPVDSDEREQYIELSELAENKEKPFKTINTIDFNGKITQVGKLDDLMELTKKAKKILFDSKLVMILPDAWLQNMYYCQILNMKAKEPDTQTRAVQKLGSVSKVTESKLQTENFSFSETFCLVKQKQTKETVEVQIVVTLSDKRLVTPKYILLKGVETNSQSQAFFTRDFLVLNGQDGAGKIHFFKFPEPSDLPAEGQPFVQNYKETELKSIKLESMFRGVDTVESGFRVYSISQKDLDILGKRRPQKNKVSHLKNAIQISIKDKSIVWDLDLNCEVHQIFGTESLNDPEHYVRTGFKIEEVTQNFILSDKTCSIFSTKLMKSGLPVLFRLFTRLDLKELIQIQEKLRTGESYNGLIDLHVLTVNLYGETFFSLNYHWMDFLETVYQQLTLHTNTDTQQVHSQQNSQEIRKMFFVLCLPFNDFRPSIQPQKQNMDQMYSRKDKTQLAWKNWCYLEAKNDTDSKVKENVQVDLKRRLERVEKKDLQQSLVYRNQLSMKQTKMQQLVDYYYQKIDCEGKDKWQNIIQYLIKSKEPTFTVLIKFLLMSNEISIQNLITDIDDFKSVFGLNNPETSNFLERSFIRTEMSSSVNIIQWEQGTKMIVFGAKHSQLTANEITQKTEEKGRITNHVISWAQKKLLKLIGAHQRRKFQPVEVRILDIKWLNKDKSIEQFYYFLGKTTDSSLFHNELIKILLKQQNYKLSIFFYAFMPFILYMFCCLVYFSLYLPNTIDPTGLLKKDQPGQSAIQMIISITTGYLSYQEYKQIRESGKSYFASFWNWLQCFCFVFNLYLVIKGSTGTTKSDGQQLQIIQCASIASILLWLLFFYWMRLFSTPAFYVRLIIQTLIDAGAFILMFVIVIIAFANGVLVIDQFLRLQQGETYQPMVQDLSGNQVVDDMLDQYMRLLGQFNFTNYGVSGSKGLIWCYFVFTTFITDIIFLNMLVATMSDTFAKVSEKRELNALEEQTQIYADFISQITKDKIITRSSYLYIVTPVYHEQQFEQVDWTGGYTLIRTQIQKLEKSLQLRLKDGEKKSQSDQHKMQSSMMVLEASQKQLSRKAGTHEDKTGKASEEQKHLERQLQTQSDLVRRLSVYSVAPGSEPVVEINIEADPQTNIINYLRSQEKRDDEFKVALKNLNQQLAILSIRQETLMDSVNQLKQQDRGDSKSVQSLESLDSIE